MTEEINMKFISTLWIILEKHVDENLSQGLTWKIDEEEDENEYPDLKVSNFWDRRKDIFDEIKRIFYRLTEKPDGSYVPLWDLMDPRPHSRYSEIFHQYFFEKQDAHNALKYILALTVEQSQPPVQYDAENAVFIKERSTFEIIANLDKIFADWEKSKDKK